MDTVFLEAHNIKNPYFGFGQFNAHLINGLYNAQIEDFKMVVHAKETSSLKSEYGDYFKYKTYKSIRRYPLFRIRKNYNVWHALNQNIKIEPYNDLPYVLTIHDVNFIDEVSSDLTHDRNVRFIEKLNRASVITYISEFAKISTHHYFDVPKNVPEYVIYNGNPVKEIQPLHNHKPNLTAKRQYIYSIGEFTPRKNFKTLVDMLIHLPDYDLILSGNNDTSYYKNILKPQIDTLGLQHRIIVTGKISDLDKQYYLKQCKAFAFPSLREGFGIPPIEAMRFGKPVFLSNNTSLPEIGGSLAYYWNNYDPEEMAKIFETGLEHFNKNIKTLEPQLIEHALSFNWNKAAKEYISVYRTLL